MKFAPPPASAPSPGYQAPPPALAPFPGYQVPVTSAPAPAPGPVVGIVRDNRANPEEGKYSFDFETEDGIVRSESGSPTGVGENPTGQQGSFKFTFPSGEKFILKFVANEGGYQPESPWIPVASAFPHPIPQFVLDQISKAAREDAEGAIAKAADASALPPSPSQTYSF